MIVDLCKPINDGESPVVRIVMTIDEAKRLVSEARWLAAEHAVGHDALSHAIDRALAREDDVR